MFPLGSQPLDRNALRQHVDAALAPLLAATPARVSLSLRDLDGNIVLAHHAELNRIPSAVISAIRSVTTVARPERMALKRSPSGTTRSSRS